MIGNYDGRKKMELITLKIERKTPFCIHQFECEIFNGIGMNSEISPPVAMHFAYTNSTSHECLCLCVRVEETIWLREREREFSRFNSIT